MLQICKKDMSKSHEYLTCPFCMNRCIETRQGKTRCPICSATFEIDDRVECVFADTDNIRLPVNGLVFGSCGLIQAGENQNCLYCGIRINMAVH